jgi:hypothetical protein
VARHPDGKSNQLRSVKFKKMNSPQFALHTHRPVSLHKGRLYRIQPYDQCHTSQVVPAEELLLAMLHRSPESQKVNQCGIKDTRITLRMSILKERNGCHVLCPASSCQRSMVQSRRSARPLGSIHTMDTELQLLSLILLFLNKANFIDSLVYLLLDATR